MGVEVLSCLVRDGVIEVNIFKETRHCCVSARSLTKKKFCGYKSQNFNKTDCIMKLN